MEVTFSSAVSKSWASFKAQWPMAVGLTLLVFAASGVIGQISGFGSILTAPLNIGWIRCMAKINDGEAVEFEELIWAYRNLERFIHALLISILYVLGIVLGGLLLVLPGVWFAIVGSLGSYYFALGDPNCVNALKRSMAAVKGRWWQMFGIFLGCMGMVILGVLCLGVGLLVALPIIGMVLINVARAWDRGPVEQRTALT